MIDLKTVLRKRLLRLGRLPGVNGAVGFSVLELIVTLLLLVVISIGMLTFMDMSNRLTRTQVAQSMMQGNQRVAQSEVMKLIRTAGIGGLSTGFDLAQLDTTVPPDGVLDIITTEGVFPRGLAIRVDNDSTDGDEITTTSDGTKHILVGGTDVLTLRGVFATPVNIMTPQVPLSLGATGNLQVTIQAEYNADAESGSPLFLQQDIETLRTTLLDGGNSEEAFVLYDRFNPGAFLVMQYDPTNSTLGSKGDNSLTIGLTLRNGAKYAGPYGRMALGTSLLRVSGGDTFTLASEGFDIRLPKTIGAIGLLQEYRFYIRKEWEIPGDTGTLLKPVLTRARFYPGTNDLHPEGTVDYANNIIDLQVALGVDLDGSGQVTEDGSSTDEVLYNDPSDDDGLSAIAGSPWVQAGAALSYVRLSTVVQADRPDLEYKGALVERVEDHVYTGTDWNTKLEYQKLRKRILRTTIELRNLP